MKKFIKRLLLISILFVGLISFFKIRETFNLASIFDLSYRQEKTADYSKLKNNLEKEANNNPMVLWLWENFDSLSDIEQKLIGNDSDTIEFVYNYENNITDFPYQEGVSKDYNRLTPYYIQRDKRWAYKSLSSSNIGFAGCGPTSMAMVLARLENDSSITPLTIAEDANSYMSENGISWQFFTDEANKYQRSIENISIDEESMINALEKGPLIVSVGPGNFTLSGHILVIDTYENGKFIINDPNSLKNTENSRSFDQLKDQIVSIWLIY
ncbi:MAG: C39 family peptidase [Peptoniphilaceae bacterium]|nr:C39 family peptidase [Peptoniphilaceae bacterium]MDY6018942.1 C39 family peptidase [Anaerococcus sp.]